MQVSELLRQQVLAKYGHCSIAEILQVHCSPLRCEGTNHDWHQLKGMAPPQHTSSITGLFTHLTSQDKLFEDPKIKTRQPRGKVPCNLQC